MLYVHNESLTIPFNLNEIMSKSAIIIKM